MKEELLNRVLEKSKEIFVKYGVKSVTMDDISKELGISKKTLYTVIKDKVDLIEKTSFKVSDDILFAINKIIEKKLDPISELLEIENFISETITGFNPSAVYQFQKYYPEIHVKLQGRQRELIVNMIKENMRRGIKDGLYRGDLNIDFIAHLDFSSGFMLLNQDFFPLDKFDFREIKREYLVYHLRGIASYRGLSFIESKLINN